MSYLNTSQLYTLKDKLINDYNTLTYKCFNNCNKINFKINIELISNLLDKIPTIVNQTYNMNPTSQNNNNFSNKIKKAFEKLKNNQQSSLYLPEDNLFLLPTPISKNIENFSKNEKFKELSNLYNLDSMFKIRNIQETLNFYLPLLQQLIEALTHTGANSWNPMLFPDSLFEFKFNLSDSFFFNILPFSKIKHFIIEDYLIFMLTIPIPSSDKFHIFKPHPFPIFFNINNIYTISIHHKPQISYLALSSDNKSYFIANDHFINSCYHTEIGIFCYINFPILNTKEDPICETTIYTQSNPHKCNYIMNINKYHFWTPLQIHYGWLYSNYFPKRFYLHCPEKPDIIIDIESTGVLQINPDCMLNPRTVSHYPYKNLKILDSSIPKQKSTISLSSISPVIFNYSIKDPLFLKEILSQFEQKEDTPLSFF